MPFKPKHPELLSEQYKNMDRIAELMNAERSHRLKAERCRIERADLKRRNQHLS